jgi:hypothetical protein
VSLVFFRAPLHYHTSLSDENFMVCFCSSLTLWMAALAFRKWLLILFFFFVQFKLVLAFLVFLLLVEIVEIGFGFLCFFGGPCICFSKSALKIISPNSIRFCAENQTILF